MSLNATYTSEPGAFISFLGQVAYDLHLIKPMVPTYIHMILSALFPIYVASHASLSRPQSAAQRKRTEKSSGEEDVQEEEVSPRMVEIMSASDAVVLPLFAGIVLTTLYFALQYIKDGLNWVLNVWFGLFGVVTIYAFLSDTFATVINFVFPASYSVGNNLVKADANGRRYRLVPGPASFKSPFPGIFRYLPLPSSVSSVTWRIRCTLITKATLTFHVRSFITVRFQATLPDLVALLLAVGLSYTHTFVAKPWLLGNLLGTSFCYFSLQTTSPSSAWIATLVLSAFFCYDIWAVFFTPMMIHVAQNVTAPLMMKFPRASGGASGLGLGDIVVPGMVMAFALQLDLHRHYLKMQKKKDSGNNNDVIRQEYRPVTGGWGERFWTAKAARPEDLKAKTFPKTYFNATIVGYILGLIASAVAVNIFDHGQPALLYLVPGVLGALWGTALVNGEVGLLWTYSESPEEEQQQTGKVQKSDTNAIAGKSKEPSEHNDDDNKDRSLVKSKQSKSSDLDESSLKSTNNSDPEPSLSPELKEIADHHLFYLAVKLPPTKTTTTASAAKDDNVTSPGAAAAAADGDDDESAFSLDSDSASDSESGDGLPGRRRRSTRPKKTKSTRSTTSNASRTDVTGAKGVRRSSRVNGAASPLAVVGGTDGKDGDEEKARMAKRRRKI